MGRLEPYPRWGLMDGSEIGCQAQCRRLKAAHSALHPDSAGSLLSCLGETCMGPMLVIWVATPGPPPSSHLQKQNLGSLPHPHLLVSERYAFIYFQNWSRQNKETWVRVLQNRSQGASVVLQRFLVITAITFSLTDHVLTNPPSLISLFHSPISSISMQGIWVSGSERQKYEEGKK